MKRVWYFLVLSLFFSGCITRVYTIEQPRKDLEVKGNQGYLAGTPPSPQEVKKKTRKVIVVEMELGPRAPEVESKEEPQEPTEEAVEETTAEEVSPEEAVLEEIPQEESLIPVKEEKPKFELYTVKKGDTLQTISYKFYGTHKKWKKIFEANKEKLKDPNKIFPGQVIKVPQD